MCVVMVVMCVVMVVIAGVAKEDLGLAVIMVLVVIVGDVVGNS
jgi:hypothetical protein